MKIKISSTLSGSIFAFITILLISFPINLHAQAEDITPPQLEDFSFTPTTIDTTSSSQIVTFNFEITDSPSGFDFTHFYLRSSSATQFREGNVYSSHRVSGTAQDGVYEFQMDFPQYSEAGTWSVINIVMGDVIGNTTTISGTELSAMGFPTELEVVSTEEDTIPPELVDFRFTPTTIDVSSSSQTVAFNFEITDNPSGFDFTHFYLRSPSGSQHKEGNVSSSHRISGTAQDGIYEFHMNFPQYTEAGVWNVYTIVIGDAVGNNITISESELIGTGFPLELVIISEHTIDAIIDFISEHPDIIGVGPGNSATNKYNAFMNMLLTVADLIEAGDNTGACDQINSIINKCDGLPNPPDFIDGNSDTTATLMGMIDDLTTNLGCE